MKKRLIEIFGWYGTIAIVGAYLLVSFSFIKSDSLIYQMLNLTGALGFIILSLFKKIYQTVALNTVWLIIALIALFQIIF